MHKLAAAALLLSACGMTAEMPAIDTGVDVPPATNGLYSETWTQMGGPPCYALEGVTGTVTNGDWCTAIVPFTATDDACATKCVAGDHVATVTLTCRRCTATYDVAFSP